MTRHPFTIAFLALFAIGLPLLGFGQLLARGDRLADAVRFDRRRIDVANDEIVQLRNDLRAAIDAQPDYAGVSAELAACHRRTESLHETLSILILDGIRWPERRALPNPPPGWSAWPTKSYEDKLGDNEETLPSGRFYRGKAKP